MRKQILFVLTLVVASLSVKAQDDSLTPLNKHDWNNVFNQKFGTLVGTTGTSNIIGNYATFDPTAGSFNLKGSIPIGKDDGKHIAYLAISANGDIISQSYTALFNNSRINTNANIQAELHFKFGTNHFITDLGQKARYQLDNWGLKDSIAKSKAAYKIELSNIPDKILLVNWQLSVAALDAADAQKQIADLKTAGIALANDPNSTLAAKKSNLEDYTKAQTALSAIQKNQKKWTYQVDSLTKAQNLKENLGDYNDAKLDTIQQTKQQKLQQKFQFEGLTFNWFTLIAAGGKKSYYTYDKTLPFSNQITQQGLGTYKFGIAYNYYDQKDYKSSALFINGGFYVERTNNTDLLSTTEIDQDYIVKNVAGDTTRKVSSKYNAYTDAVENYRQWVVYGNLYYLFGKHISGVHIFPSLYMRDQKKGYLDLGLGYVVSFTNTKDKSILNLEGYVVFNDLTNSIGDKTHFQERNEIGIRLTLPFTFLLK